MNGRSNFGRLRRRAALIVIWLAPTARGRNLFLGFFLVRQVVSACNSMITQEHFKQLAAYNRWANARLYAAALDLSELSYRLHTGVYFGSLHGTLNHLLLTDRLWLKRLTGEGDLPNDLNAILYEDRIELTKARIAEDNRLRRSDSARNFVQANRSAPAGVNLTKVPLSCITSQPRASPGRGRLGIRPGCRHG